MSATSIKAVALNYRDNNFIFESIESIELPKGSIIENNIENFAGVLQALKKVIKRMNPATHNAAISISGSAVIIKQIKLDSKKIDDLEHQVILEANNHIPYSLDDIAMDFEVIGFDKKNKQYDIVIVGCKRDQVDSRDLLLKQAGLNSCVIDIEAYAIERFFNNIISLLPFKLTHNVIAVFDVGASCASVNIIEKGRNVFQKEYLIGGRQLTENIQQHYGYDLLEAEQRKLNVDLPKNYDSEILTPFKENLIVQLSRALQMFLSNRSYTKLDGIVLIGGASNITGLAEQIEKQEAIKTISFNLFNRLKVNKKNKMISSKSNGSEYCVACGLAMRRKFS